jgi:hypothetical protein
LKRDTVLYPLLLAGLFLVHVGPFGRHYLSRELIDYDDRHFVEPLRQVSLHEYLTDWLPSGEKDSYPLKDLTYLVDFELSKALGFNTFWLTNLALFFAIVLLYARTTRQLLPEISLGWRWMIVAAYALHPLQTQVLQWAINRKHLLVLLLILVSLQKILSLRRKNRLPGQKDYLGQFALFLLILASFPSGVLWFSFVLFAFRRDWPKKVGRWIWPALNAAIAGTYVIFLLTHHSGYSDQVTHTGSAAAPFLANLVSTVGRSAYNLFYPFDLSIYYSPGSFRNLIGLAVLGCVAGGVVWVGRHLKKSVQRRDLLSNLELGAAACAAFLPPLAITISETQDFILADRYLFFALPFLLLLFVRAFRGLESAVPRGVPLLRALPVALFLVAFGGESARQALLWLDARSVLHYCAAAEKNPKCLLLAIEKGYDAFGCQAVKEDMVRAKRELRKMTQWHDLVLELPFYESLCVAIDDAKPMIERQKRIRAVRDAQGNACGTGFNEVLLEAASAGPAAGLAKAKETYLHPGECTLLTRKLVNVLSAQLDFLCEQAADEECPRLRSEFSKITSNVPVVQKQRTWAKNVTAKFSATSDRGERSAFVR